MLSKRQMLRVDSFIVAQNNLLHQQNEETTAAFSHKRTNTYTCNNMDGSKNQVSRLPGPVVKRPPANIGDAGSVSGPRRLCMSQGNQARVPQLLQEDQTSSILKEISPEYSLEGLMLKLLSLLQYFGHLVQRTDSLEKTLMLEKIEGRRRRG